MRFIMVLEQIKLYVENVMKKMLLILFLFIGQANADNGVFAINNVCMGFGCFPGDSSGLPITITNSGSYQLTSNIVSSSTTTNVIEINADNVTLDLNGFSIIGPRTCTGLNSTLVCTNSTMSADGIQAQNHSNIVIKNGFVQGFMTAIALSDNSLKQFGNRLDAVHVSESVTGILAVNAMISNSMAFRNLGQGFLGNEFGLLFIKDSYGYSNKGGDVNALICSNDFFKSPSVNLCTFTN